MEFRSIRDSLVAADLAYEINFSFIRSEPRNRLGNLTARKFVYAFANSMEFKEWIDKHADDEKVDDDSADDDLD